MDVEKKLVHAPKSAKTSPTNLKADRTGRGAHRASAAPRTKPVHDGEAAHLKVPNEPIAKNRATSKTSAAPHPKPDTPKSRRLEIVATNEAEADRETARVALTNLPSAIVAVDFARHTSGDVSLMETLAVLRSKSEAVNAGNLQDAEAMLMTQAIALNTVFGELARRAALNMGEYLDATDKYMRLALKAQGQCRATLETLAVIKNPPVLFAKQANIAHGPQQVNNGTPLPARTENATIAPNELLEAHAVTRLDTGATAATGGGDPALATMGAVYRT